MPKGSPELTASRKEEIVNACEKLYQVMSFKEITLKEISVETSFSRPSIYNYFQTKEEIFLALMQREYELWAAELVSLADENSAMSAEDFASALAHSLEKRQQLLKLLAMNHYDMEEHSRPERLTEFKAAYGASLDAVRACVKKFFPETDCESFIFVFFPFLFGVYPYSVATQKQLDAMREAKLDFKMHSIYEIIYSCVLQLLSRKI
ncbi:transcriptional regulator, TetR family [Ruminococcus sp. YE71]|uniref:TetR family transcriptional regulator n=1 Tax=unclassified Ruminococcus TaxID=2608920 RepID=UPI00088A1DD8|nr:MULTISPECIES: TetR family transcriptional regulator [unclassified Ruminococcus]SDA28818.1 transcriptional regulator, TetR family [Ruminococcus sp. YE78]SFW47014.1 transcriptional regulator, TetR family [Ruminococcus sp. YE71]